MGLRSPRRISRFLRREEPNGETEEVEDTQEVEVIEETTVEDAVAADAIPVQDMTAPDATEREIAAAALIQRVYRKIPWSSTRRC